MLTLTLARLGILTLLTMPSLKSVQRELKLSMRQLTAVDAVLKLYSSKSETNQTVMLCFKRFLCRLLKSARGNIDGKGH